MSYQAKCLTTESTEWHEPNQGLLHAALGLMTETVELLDFKNHQNFLEELGDICWYVAVGANHLELTIGDLQDMSPRNRADDEDLIRGLVMDASVIVDQLKKSIFYGRALDRTRVATLLAEILDTVDTLALEVGSDLDEVMHLNIAKLQRRFKKGFTQVEANNRDVNHEMQVY